VIVRLVKLTGSLVDQFFETDRSLFSLSQIPGRLVLSHAGAQRGLHPADKGHRLDWPLLQRDVTELRDQLDRMLPRSRVVAAGRQDDEREIGPGRLLVGPLKKTSGVGPEKGLF